MMGGRVTEGTASHRLCWDRLRCSAWSGFSRRSTRGTGLSLLLALLLAAASLAARLPCSFAGSATNPLLSQQTVWRQDPEATVLPSDLVSPFRSFVIPPLAVPPARSRRHRRPASRRAARQPGAARLAGRTFLDRCRLPTPQATLGGFLPPLGRARVPTRFGVAGVFGLAILCGLAFATVAHAIDRRLGGGAIARGMSLMLAGRSSGECWATLAASRATCCRTSCPRRSSRRRRARAGLGRLAGRRGPARHRVLPHGPDSSSARDVPFDRELAAAAQRLLELLPLGIRREDDPGCGPARTVGSRSTRRRGRAPPDLACAPARPWATPLGARTAEANG